MKILVVGSGGREHALVRAFAGSGKHCVIAAPGNPGIAGLAGVFNVAAGDLEGQRNLAVEEKVDLVVVGPEVPLVKGLGDMLREAGIPCFGPGSDGAALEGSKWFAKDVMNASGVLTAGARVFTEARAAIEYMGDSPEKFVIKADGLAAGKGVFLPDNGKEAENTIRALFGGSLGESREKVVIELRLEGQEISILAICNGRDTVVLPPSSDHKRIGEGDTGLNTGGMGAICPPVELGEDFTGNARRTIILPVLRELTSRGIDYRGVLYAGLMITEKGPVVLEFNVRFGDPETQAVLPMLEDDLAELCLLAATGADLPDSVSTRKGSSACVILASGGYPGSYATGFEITGIGSFKDTIVFHAGTITKGERLVTGGGRVLGVTGLGATLDDALNRAYDAIGSIGFEGMYFRRDIGRTI